MRIHPLDNKLTNREREVLTLLAKGFSNARIGKELSIEDSTVEKHCTSIYEKLGVENRTQAAMCYLANVAIV